MAPAVVRCGPSRCQMRRQPLSDAAPAVARCGASRCQMRPHLVKISRKDEAYRRGLTRSLAFESLRDRKRVQGDTLARLPWTVGGTPCIPGALCPRARRLQTWAAATRCIDLSDSRVELNSSNDGLVWLDRVELGEVVPADQLSKPGDQLRGFVAEVRVLLGQRHGVPHFVRRHDAVQLGGVPPIGRRLALDGLDNGS